MEMLEEFRISFTNVQELIGMVTDLFHQFVIGLLEMGIHHHHHHHHHQHLFWKHPGKRQALLNVVPGEYTDDDITPHLLLPSPPYP